MTTQAEKFVRNYALTCYLFDGDPEDKLVARLIHKYARGKKVLDLGCGPVEPVLSVFYPDAKEVVAVDRLKENIEYIKKHSDELNAIVKRARKYKHRYLTKKDSKPKIKLIRGDVRKRLKLGKFDTVMQIGCFGGLANNKEFQHAVNNAVSYLKKGGTLLMVNWLDEKKKVKRPYNFNNKVRCLEIFKPSMKKAKLKIKEIHTTSKLQGSKKLGYTRIVWAVAKK